MGGSGLSGYAHKLVQILFATDNNTTTEVSIAGHRLVGIALPSTLEVGGGLTITPQVDPGDGVFRSVKDEGSVDVTFTTVVADDYLLLPLVERPVGARCRLEFSENQTADRNIFLLLEKL